MQACPNKCFQCKCLESTLSLLQRNPRQLNIEFALQRFHLVLQLFLVCSTLQESKKFLGVLLMHHGNSVIPLVDPNGQGVLDKSIGHLFSQGNALSLSRTRQGYTFHQRTRWARWCRVVYILYMYICI